MRRRVATQALIVTADDFGLSIPVNEAVERAHTGGILTAASLLVGAPSAMDAVERARRLPALGVGLHVNLVEGWPALPPDRVPGLIGPDGRFSDKPVSFGIRLFFSKRLQHQAEAEIAAQFERFAATGLPLDHVNGHQHFHIHPTVASIITKLAPRYGHPPVRVPREPFIQSYRAMRDRPLRRLASWIFFLTQTYQLRHSLRRANLSFNDHVFGLNDTGAMIERRLLQFLDHVPAGVSEFYCHPATRRWNGPDNLPADYRVTEELDALVSARVKRKVQLSGIATGSYRDVFPLAV